MVFVGKKMAATIQDVALLLVLVVSHICLQTAADSTIQNAAYTPILLNGRPLYVGQILTIVVAEGKSPTTMNVTYIRNVTGIRIRNGREYFVIDNQNGSTGFIRGRQVRSLDLVEGKKIESAF